MTKSLQLAATTLLGAVTLTAQTLSPTQLLDEVTHSNALQKLSMGTTNHSKSLPRARRLEADMTRQLEELVDQLSKTKAIPKTTKSVTLASANSLATPLEAVVDNTSDASGGCGCNCPTNSYQPFGIPPFTSWSTDSLEVNHTYPGYLQTDTLLTHTNDYGIRTYYGYLEPNVQGVRSAVYVNMSNHYDSNGDPLSHQLSFWYYYIPINFDLARCAVSVDPGNTGIAFTNLPSTISTNSSWRHVTMTVPPWISYSNSPMMLVFGTWRVGNVPNQGSTLYVDPAIQWCPITRPTPTATDLWVGYKTNTVTVSWNTQTYYTNRWTLQFTSYLGGVWSTNIQQAPVYSNNAAKVTFSTTNGMRYYRLVKL